MHKRTHAATHLHRHVHTHTCAPAHVSDVLARVRAHAARPHVYVGAAAAAGAHAVQVATWNDWREGTVVEPSAEEGFTQLLRLQQIVLGMQDAEPMREVVREYNALKAPTWHCTCACARARACACACA